MARAYGSSATLLIARESTYGQSAASGFHRMPFNRCSLGSEQGLIDDPVLIQLCMGIPYGAPNDPLTLMSLVHNLPAGAQFSAFSIGRDQLPYAAMATLAGGNVRVGLEDNLWLEKGVKATNAQLVERARGVVEGMGARVMGPAEVREKLKLVKHD